MSVLKKRKNFPQWLPLVAMAVLCLAAQPVRADLFDEYDVRPLRAFHLPTSPNPADRGPAVFDNLADGRLVVLSTKITDAANFVGVPELYVESSVGSRSFTFVGNLPLSSGGIWSSFGGAFLRVSPDGSSIAVGDNDFLNPRVGVFAASNLMSLGASSVNWLSLPHSSAAWVDDGGQQLLAINSGDFSSSQVHVLSFTDLMSAPTSKVAISNIGGASSGIGFDTNGNMYVGNGFDGGPGGSTTGDIKRFAFSDWKDALSSGTPQNFESQGTFIAKSLAAGALELDAEGNLFIGGSDFFSGGQSNFLALLSTASPPVVRTFDPDTAFESSYVLAFNEATGELYAYEPFPLIFGDAVDNTLVHVIHTVPEPSAYVLSLLAAAGFWGYARRKRPKPRPSKSSRCIHALDACRVTCLPGDVEPA